MPQSQQHCTHAMAQAGRTLAEDEVHIWYSGLAFPQSVLQSLARTLSPEEWHRAERFYSARDRGQFIAARGVLRTLLAQYSGVAPAELRFSYGGHGKPWLSYPDESTFRFNVSHSNGAAIWGLTSGREIGVDLEQIWLMPDLLLIADGYLSKRDRTVLRSLETEEQTRFFFRCWTRKEALLKAIGEGLSGSLAQAEIDLGSEPVQKFHLSSSPPGLACWSLHDLSLIPGYAAAVAVAGSIRMLSCRALPESCCP